MNTTQFLGFIIALVIAAIVIIPLGSALRKHPGPFYAVAILLTIAYVWAIYSGIKLNAIRPLAVIMQKGYLAVIFLLVVMFTGVFDEGTPVRKKLQPIRGELSILSFIFILAHLSTYLPVYLPRLGKIMSSSTNVAVSLVIAFVLTIIFAVLSVMSLRVIRHTMNQRVWKNIQRLSYLMMVLLAAHIGLVLGRSAFVSGFTLATLGFFLYLGVLVIYAILRIRKAVRDSKKKQLDQAGGASQGKPSGQMSVA